MRILMTILLILIGKLACISQESAYSRLDASFISREPKELPTDHIKTDYNGDTLSIVVVKSPLKDLIFEGNIFGEPLKNYNSETNVYQLYMTKGSRNLKIRSNNFHQVDVEFPKAIHNDLWELFIRGIEVEAPQVTTAKEVNHTHRVKIDAEPFAQILVDNKSVPNSNTVVLEEGTHFISSKYKGVEYNQKVDINFDGQTIDAKMCGTVVVKSASSINFYPINATPPHLQFEEGSTFGFDEMLGKYTMVGKPNNLTVRKIEKTINVRPRTHTEFRLDEMISYLFLLYHGTNLQPFGANIGFCKDFGLFISGNWDARTSIKTEYGETDFYNKKDIYTTDDPDDDGKELKSTSMTFSIGPMFRLWRKLYLQVGGGVAYYLSTSEEKILTADYSYKSALSLNTELLLRIKTFVIGAGYTHQFVKNAYNPKIANQLSFSLGFILGY